MRAQLYCRTSQPHRAGSLGERREGGTPRREERPLRRERLGGGGGRGSGREARPGVALEAEGEFGLVVRERRRLEVCHDVGEEVAAAEERVDDGLEGAEEVEEDADGVKKSIELPVTNQLLLNLNVERLEDAT